MITPFNKVLEHFINKKNISKAEVSRRLEVSETMVHYWVKGVGNPPGEELLRKLFLLLRLDQEERDTLYNAAVISTVRRKYPALSEETKPITMTTISEKDTERVLKDHKPTSDKECDGKCLHTLSNILQDYLVKAG